jgi:hypothetical protein
MDEAKLHFPNSLPILNRVDSKHSVESKNRSKQMSTSELKDSPTLGTFSGLGKGLMGFQKQVIEFQKAAFDSTFDAVVAIQDQQEQFFADMLERSNTVPEEGKELVNEWIETFRRSREDFKAAADKSYGLMEHYLDRSEDEAGLDSEDNA